MCPNQNTYHSPLCLDHARLNRERYYRTQQLADQNRQARRNEEAMQERENWNRARDLDREEARRATDLDREEARRAADLDREEARRTGDLDRELQLQHLELIREMNTSLEDAKHTRCLSRDETGEQCWSVALPGKQYCTGCSCQADGCDAQITYDESFYCPKHQCQADGCITRASDSCDYCNNHRCQVVTTTHRCRNPTSDQEWFCTDHVCQYDDCAKQRDSGTYFCSDHYDQ